MSVRSKLVQMAVFGGAGAALSHFLDPDRGRARRARARDQLIARARRTATDVEKQARYYEGKLEGARARADGHGELKPEDDHDIKQGVQQRLAATDAQVTDVVIDVTDGVVGLRGQVPSLDQLKAVELAAADVPGVREIESWLHLPGTPAPNKASSRQAG